MGTRIFISFQHSDEALAGRIENALKSHGYVFQLGATKKPYGRFEDRFSDELARAHVLVALLTPAGISSPWVVSQVGMGLAYERSRDMLILPVVIEPADIPDFVRGLNCTFLGEGTDHDVNRVVQQLHDSIQAYLNDRRSPKIFISHRHSDADVVRALVRLLEKAFAISATDLRCTSVEPYILPLGERTSERLRKDLQGAEVVLGVLGPDAAESAYVLTELGAAWGADTPTFPLLVRGARHEDVPDPLRERKSLSLEVAKSGHQLVMDIARASSIEPHSDAFEHIRAEAENLAAAAAKTKKQGKPRKPGRRPQPKRQA